MLEARRRYHEELIDKLITSYVLKNDKAKIVDFHNKTKPEDRMEKTVEILRNGN